VAEHAVGLLLSLYHHIPRAFNEIKNGQWNMEANRTTELEGRTIGIIGYGNTGSAFARKLKAFNVQVLAYDKYKKKYTDDFAKESSMEEIFSAADVLSLHVPLTTETKYLVNEEFINRFQKSFYLLNTSRGGVVNTRALIEALKKKKISGAALDVLENENISAYTEEEKNMLGELINAGEVVITPHIAGKSFYTRRKFAEALLDKIKNL
jgi:D-3-phosphoglycerate dehydrogenase